MANGNGIDLSKLCILENRLCWIVYIDALISEDNGNVFDALWLASTACLKQLVIPSLSIKNREQYTRTKSETSEYTVDKESLFKNTEITKKAIILKMQQKHKQKPSKFSGQQLPFQDSVALNVPITVQQMDVSDIAEIEFVIDGGQKGEALYGLDMLPVVVTMAIMDGNEYFVVDPLFEEEICCDVIVRIAVSANGTISVIKYGEKAIDPLLIFDMIESGKQSGLKWMHALNESLKEMRDDVDKGRVGVSDLSKFELTQSDEKEIEIEMMKQLETLSFVTGELQKEENGNAKGRKKDISATKSSKLHILSKQIESLHPNKIAKDTASFLNDDSSDTNLSYEDEQMIDID